MRAKQDPTGDGTVDIAKLRQLLLAIGVLASVFALLVAVSYTGVAAAVVTGTMATAVLGLGITRLTSKGVCVPGTDVCLQSTS
jgi:tetrahydromethanopterin S-methyltransferase subunit C